MSVSTYELPQRLGNVLARLPASPGALLFCKALNLALAGKLAPDVTDLLAGRTLRLCVKDAQWVFDFAWSKHQFTATTHRGPADLTLSACAHDYFLLATRQEDPDTLFFNRRLCMEGDTELGLLVKNTLDALELPAFRLDALKPATVLGKLKARFAPG